MRILFSTFWFLPDIGGVNAYLQLLKEKYEEQGHEVDILAHHPSMKKIHLLNGPVYDKKILLKYVYDEVYRFYEETMPYVVPSIRWQEIERYTYELMTTQFDLSSYDLIHTQDIFSAIAISRVKPASTPHIATLHGLVAYEKILQGDIIKKQGIEWEYASMLEKLGATSADETIVITDWLKNELTKHFDVPSQSLHVIPHGLDMNQLKIKAEVEPKLTILDSTKNQFIIACPARLATVKGHNTLIDALKILKLHIDQFICLFIGDGPLETELKQLCEKHQVQDFVSFLGQRDDVPAIIKNADCVVLPSLQENHPFVIMEGQTLGKTVVASNVGGIPEMIEDGKSGLLFEKQNSEQLADILLRLMRNPSWNQKIGEQSKIWAHEHWSLELLAGRTFQVYKKAIEKVDKRKPEEIQSRREPSELFSFPPLLLSNTPAWEKAADNLPIDYKLPDRRLIQFFQQSSFAKMFHENAQEGIVTGTGAEPTNNSVTEIVPALDSSVVNGGNRNILNPRICIVILAHEKEEVLKNQIENIRRFVPNSTIVLFNSSLDEDFGKSLGIPICPKSRHLQMNEIATVLKDVIDWLPQTSIEYDFLMYMDSDMMFIRSGFLDFLQKIMSRYDAVGINMGIQRSPEDVPHWIPGQQMWSDQQRWVPLFDMKQICGTLNSMQVYRKAIVDQMFTGINREKLDQFIQNSNVFALEEILFATLALRAGAKICSYPYYTTEFVRLGNPLSIEEVKEALKDEVYFVHPIARDLSDPARQFITNELLS
nr:glycosyltransferase family 4 protein [Lysinibacillus timonensis]